MCLPSLGKGSQNGPLLQSHISSSPYLLTSCEDSFGEMASFQGPRHRSCCQSAAYFQSTASLAVRTVLLPGHWEWIIWKRWLPEPFHSLSCSHLQPASLSERVSANTVCCTAVRQHWHGIEKALKMAINHLIYVGSDLYWYSSGYHLKWFVFHFTLYMRVITVHATYNRHGYYGQLVIVDKNWFPKPNILNPIHFS